MNIGQRFLYEIKSGGEPLSSVICEVINDPEKGKKSWTVNYIKVKYISVIRAHYEIDRVGYVEYLSPGTIEACCKLLPNQDAPLNSSKE